MRTRWDNCKVIAVDSLMRDVGMAIRGPYVRGGDGSIWLVADPKAEDLHSNPKVSETEFEAGPWGVGVVEPRDGQKRPGVTRADLAIRAEGPNIIEGSEEMAEEDRCGFDTRIVIELDVPESWNAGDATFAEKTIEGEAGHETSFYGLLWDRWPVRFGWSEWIT